MIKLDRQKITDIVLKYHTNCQAIYLFGSFADGSAHAKSDIDIALLLPHDEAKQIPSFAMSDVLYELGKELKHDIDLVNLRKVSTVFQNQITETGKVIFCADRYAKDEFEMLTLSFYQKLNQERKEILEKILKRKI